jgi:hypothetical protein
MSATVSGGGQGTSITADTTLASSANLDAAIGDWVLVEVAASNDGTNGAASGIASIVDSDGVNVYTLRATINYDPGAAGAGATLYFFTCPVTDALTSASVTVTFSVNTSEKAMQVWRIQPGAGEVISLVSVDTTGSTGSATTHSAPTVSVPVGGVIFAAAAIETDDTVTGDSDTTNGAWAGLTTRLADNGADAATMSLCMQGKIVTGAGDQAWACTTVSGRDSARSTLVLKSVVPPASNIKAASNHIRQMAAN